MTKLRIDHMIEQYVWTLENDSVFVCKAKHDIERGNFNMFRDLCGQHIRSVRQQIGESFVGALTGAEWSFLYLETWVRLGGFNILMSNLYYDKDVMFQLKRLESAGFGVSRQGVVKASQPLNNPCAEIEISAPQPCVLAEPEKEEPMSALITVTKKTLINNVDVTTMSDEQLISSIVAIEGEIVSLKAIKTKSIKIAAKIADAQATLAQVVELLDSRA
jgi:hypothetical protein